MSDIVLEILQELRASGAKQCATAAHIDTPDAPALQQALARVDTAIAEYKRTTDLHKTITETIRTEIRHEMEGRRDAALAAFERAHDRLALTLLADERAAN